MKSNIITSEAEVVNCFRQGDERAINYLFKRYYRELTYFCYSIVKYKPQAEDIAVDVFIKLLENKRLFEKYSDIQGFLYTAAKNQCLDYLKHKKRASKSEKEIARMLEHDENYFERKIAQTRMVGIAALIDKLPSSRKEIMNLLLQGLSVRDIADRLDISVDTVRVQKFLAVNYLREKV